MKEKIYYHSRLGDVHYGLGRCYAELYQLESAKKWLQLAKKNYKHLSNHKNIAKINELLVKILSTNLRLHSLFPPEKNTQEAKSNAHKAAPLVRSRSF